MTLNVGDVAGRMATMQKATATGSRVAVVAAAAKSKAIIAGGAPGRLRGVGKSGSTLGVRYTIRGGEQNPSAELRATGPWQLIERDTKAHQIGPKKRRTGRGGGVVVPGVGVFRSVQHPGTIGKHPWEKGVAKAEPVAAAEMRKSMSHIVTAAFSG